MKSFQQILAEINRASCDTIDPTQGMSNYGGQLANAFNGTATTVAQPASQTVAVSPSSPIVQFSVTLTNTMLEDLNIELFQFDASQTKMIQLDVNNYQPVSAAQFNVNFTPAANQAANTYYFGSISGNLTSYVNAGGAPNTPTNNVVGFDPSGNLVYQPGLTTGGASVAGNVTISCQQVPYRQLFENSGKYPFRVVKMRMVFSSANQIPNVITQVEKSFLGSKQQDQVSPDTYFTPNQFQGLRVDVPTPFVITPERGLTYSIMGQTNSGVASNSVKINMFLQLYTKGSI